MRSIPPELLEKIQKAYQTIYDNNAPYMDIIAAQGLLNLMLTPYTMRTGASFGPLDIAVRREDANRAPQGLSQVYIENGIAKVAWLDLYAHVGRGWKWQYDIGPAIDCAIDYDGRWVRVQGFSDMYFYVTYRWALTTFGEPYIALVKPDGSLTVQQGQGAPLTLAADGVSKVSLMRAWKNVLLWNHDHGIIAAYIRNGEVRYRSYAQQADGVTTLWENERTLTEFDTSVNPAVNLALFRTNDYRTGILVEIDGQIHMATSTRNWAGMAIQDHTISVTGTGVTVDLIPVVFEEFQHNHTISIGSEAEVYLLWAMPENSFRSAENDGNLTVIAVTRHFLTDVSPADFIIEDETSATFSVDFIEVGDTPFELILTVDNLNFSYPGDLTLKFLGSGTTKGEAGQDHDPFEITFTPQGLEYVLEDPPEVEAIWNE